ncbi:MAG: glutaminase [Alphaproteobacteria bacterium]|nr:glutaminase [Alphaproteobacteria bacterium]
MHGDAPEPLPHLQAIVNEIVDRIADETERGQVATYIPELAKADLSRFGLAVVPVGADPTVCTLPIVGGDADLPFSIQSVSKVFTLAMALQKSGTKVWRRVGREASGNAFNSIVQLEYEHGIPRNPFINAGAIVVADLLLDGQAPPEAIAGILDFVRQAAGDDSIAVDAAVAASERATGDRNRALANFMKAEGNIRHAVDDVLEVYFNQCSIAMSCRQLALAGRFLANPEGAVRHGLPLVSARRIRRIAALMLTCGHYDASGEFAFQVGIPGKSGVGGGILGVVPGRAAIAAWCPGLSVKGNSLMGALAFRELARATGWSVFGPMGD